MQIMKPAIVLSINAHIHKMHKTSLKMITLCLSLQTTCRTDGQLGQWHAGAGLAVLCWALGVGASPPLSSPLLAAAPLYVCPGPLFTNDIRPAQARAQGCSLAQQGRWSQAQAPEQPEASAPLASTALPSSRTTSDKVNASASANTPSASDVANSQQTTPAVPLAQPSLPYSTSLPPASAATGASAQALPVRAALPKPEPQAAPAEPGIDALRQRQRDRHAREIVLAELASTQARIQSLSARPQVSADDENALQRLRRDEDALRRELAKRPG